MKAGRPTAVSAFVIGAVALGGILRFEGLGVKDLSGDESFSWRMIQYPVGEMLHRLGDDVHPPLYYLTLKLWTSFFGESLGALRGLSALLGTLAIVAACLLATMIDRCPAPADGSLESGPRAGVAATLLVAVSPFHVAYSRTARMYALGDFLAVLSTWLFLSLLQQPRPSARRLFAYTLAASGFLYTHYYSVFTIAGHGLAAVVACLAALRGGVGGLRRFVRLFAGLATAALLYLPWLPSQIGQMRSVWIRYWIPQLDGATLLDLGCRFISGLGYVSPVVAAIATAWGVLVVVGLLNGYRPGRFFLAAMILAPWIGGVGLALFGKKTVLLERYLLFAHLFYLIALAVVLAGTKPAPIRVCLLTMLVLGSILGLNRGSGEELWQGDRGSFEQLVRKLSQRSSAGRRIVVGGAVLANSLLYHASRSDDHLRLMVLGEPPADGGHEPYHASIPQGDWLAASRLPDLGPEPITVVIDEDDGAQLTPLAGRGASSFEIISQNDGTRWHLVDYNPAGARHATPKDLREEQ